MEGEQLVDQHLRQLEDGIRYIESTVLLMRQALTTPTSAEALATAFDRRVTALLNAVEDQLSALDLLRADIAELRIQAHGSRRRRPRT